MWEWNVIRKIPIMYRRHKEVLKHGIEECFRVFNHETKKMKGVNRFRKLVMNVNEELKNENLSNEYRLDENECNELFKMIDKMIKDYVAREQRKHSTS